ncbi:MAG: hypothetical protein PHX08_16965 [Lachnospiraceae bacterium]|nr:hypothetical protein [Lachnospiraceae bacterium]
MIKHSYDVTGNSSSGEKFIGICVSTDIMDVIKMFREKHYSVHTVNRGMQVHADSEIGIEFIGSYPYNRKDLFFSEILVAEGMYTIFKNDDLENFVKVRKQILKNLQVSYFKNHKKETMTMTDLEKWKYFLDSIGIEYNQSGTNDFIRLEINDKHLAGMINEGLDIYFGLEGSFVNFETCGD